MTAARILELENENTALRSRLRDAGLMPPPASLPDENQLDALIEIALSVHAKLCSSTAEAPLFRDHFANALHAICFMRKQNKPNSAYYPSAWSDAAAQWLARYMLGTTSLRAFVGACVVSGVAYTPLTRFPFDVELGLTVGGVSVPSSKWRDVLAAGKAPPPLELRRPLSRARPREILVGRVLDVVDA